MEAREDFSADKGGRGMNRIEHKPGVLSFHGKRTLFRSRLEARWALYFASRGMQWEYEPFKFPIGGKGVTYTPDFKVDEIGIIEVKPYFDSLAESAERIERYIEKTGERVNLFYGSSPANCAVMILNGNPLMGLSCDMMQRALILGGTKARAFAVENYGAFYDSVCQGLAMASGHVEFEPLTAGELMEADQAGGNVVLGRAIMRRILQKPTKRKQAA